MCETQEFNLKRLESMIEASEILCIDLSAQRINPQSGACAAAKLANLSAFIEILKLQEEWISELISHIKQSDSEEEITRARQLANDHAAFLGKLEQEIRADFEAKLENAPTSSQILVIALNALMAFRGDEEKGDKFDWKSVLGMDLGIED